MSAPAAPVRNKRTLVTFSSTALVIYPQSKFDVWNTYSKLLYESDEFAPKWVRK